MEAQLLNPKRGVKLRNARRAATWKTTKGNEWHTKEYPILGSIVLIWVGKNIHFFHLVLRPPVRGVLVPAESLGIWPSGWIPCSKQKSSQQALPIWTPPSVALQVWPVTWLPEKREDRSCHPHFGKHCLAMPIDVWKKRQELKQSFDEQKRGFCFGEEQTKSATLCQWFGYCKSDGKRQEPAQSHTEKLPLEVHLRYQFGTPHPAMFMWVTGHQ